MAINLMVMGHTCQVSRFDRDPPVLREQLPQSSATPTNLPFWTKQFQYFYFALYILFLSNSSLKLVYKSVAECKKDKNPKIFVIMDQTDLARALKQKNWELCTLMQEYTTFDLLYLMPWLEMTSRKVEFASEKCIQVCSETI